LNKFKLIATCCSSSYLWRRPRPNRPSIDQSTVEQQKIDWLIDSVATLHDARFIRNGQAYDATRAADHLRLKLRFAGDRVKTAEDFIDYCATRSSMSGRRYSIRFADGRTVDAATFLRERLAAYPAIVPHVSH
jgi:hypothetical protein